MTKRCNTQGTSSIVDEVTHQPLLSVLSGIVETAVKLVKDGHHVIIVSSGAIGVGLQRMDMVKKPSDLPKVQVSMSLCHLSTASRMIPFFSKWKRTGHRRKRKGQATAFNI